MAHPPIHQPNHPSHTTFWMTVSGQRCVWAPRKSAARRSRYCGEQNVHIRDGDAGVWMRRVTTFSSCV